ncbi:MAG: hypothetical protein GX594_19520 [Pirellulaceae bacterium]|nr:hypothetical protein [Pirellulaceae bacterium]
MYGAIIALLAFGVVSAPGEFQAGVARKVITPTESVWLSGYAARTKASEGVEHDLWVKALSLEDAQGGRVVIIAADLIGLPRGVCEEVAARVKDKHGLERGQLVFNASHTHSGPMIRSNLDSLFDGDAGDLQRLIEYRRRLVDALVEVVGLSLADLSPATLEVGHSSAEFAINRRQSINKNVKIGVNPVGPVDHDVPVLKIASADGKVRAVLFGYACHNTTLGGNSYLINGDYAGFAQSELEKDLPGATAMFLQLCGGDQNPHPRGTMELARGHGKTLAGAVLKALEGELKPITPAIRTAYDEVKLEIARKDRAVFEAEAKSDDRFRRRRAESILEALDAGRDVWHVSAPVQVVAFGGNLAMVALGGEVVVDYSLRLKREFPDIDLIVAGYSNDVMCYVPSRRVLREGGYEPDSSMIYYGIAGPFTENVEDAAIEACRRVLAQAGVKRENPTAEKTKKPID